MKRTCPVCRTGKIWRREVRTCSWHCSQIWRTWSPATQAKAVEQADAPVVNIDDLKPLPESQGDEAEEDDDTPDFLKQ